ncbi:MAG: hypothetical protein CSB46_02840 [Micrococcales bacterium]|nr:MAG: hypothetical protein CSB46_02840 [Micrococcales bacterium]
MSMLQRFFVFLEELLRNNDGPVEPEALKAEMEANGFAEVTSGDVLDAVTLMCGEGNVFDASQVQALRAYTGGNSVDQGFGGASVASHQVSAPQPPPMDPKEGYTNLDAAVEHISYVSNVTNNTTINDQDTFEDNDTIVDNSVDQTIIADGDVYQDIDNATATDGGVANTGLIEDSTLVTGENDGIIADDVEDSVLVTGDVGGSVARDVEDSNYAGGDNRSLPTGPRWSAPRSGLSPWATGRPTP